jgi:hypothetical protein
MTENDFDRTAQLWLEDGPTVMSDRALQAALDEIHVTRQRRAWWPARRSFQMSPSFRLAIGAAAVLAVAFIAINLLPGRTSVGNQPTAVPPSAAPPSVAPSTASPAALTPIPLPLFPEVLVASAKGTYLAGDPFQIPMTVTMPAGWQGNVGGPYAAYFDKATGQSPGIAFTISQTFYSDPCKGEGLLDPQPGPTVDDLAATLAALPGLNATTPTAVTVDGHPAKQLTLTAPDSIAACSLTDGALVLWQLPLGATFTLEAAQQRSLWIVDVDGQRLVISADRFPSTTPEDLAAAQGILDSIRIKPKN